MVYNYINNLDKQVNETLTLYKNLAKLSRPMIQYIIFILSLLVFTCCFILLFYCYNNDISHNDVLNTNYKNNNDLFINIILPIMLYGLLCPILSTIISSIFKIFFDTLMQKIRTKHLYIKHIIKDNNIINYLIFHKVNIIYPFLYIFIYNLNDFIIYTYILIYLCIQFNRIFIFYTNTIDCKIISIEKCYNNNDNYWNFELEINTNLEKKTVNKRFNDFKQLSNNYNYNNIKLPTSSWLFKPNNIDEATTRAVELNKYIKKITNDDSLLQNSVFFNFINTNTSTSENTNINNIVLEKDYINNDYLKIYNNIENIKKQCSLLISDFIKYIFIFNEINYYNSLKKRIIVITDSKIYKIKYYITLNIFEVRNTIKINNINNIIYSTINNTNNFYKKKILVIYYNDTYLQFISLGETYFYNINSLIEILQNYNVNIEYTDNFNIDNGFGLSEIVLNSNIVDLFKNSYYKSISILK
jgi:hypothetical protein